MADVVSMPDTRILMVNVGRELQAMKNMGRNGYKIFYWMIEHMDANNKVHRGYDPELKMSEKIYNRDVAALASTKLIYKRGSSWFISKRVVRWP